VLQSPPPSSQTRNHACVDGFVSLGVLASAAVVSLGLNLADPIIGLIITAVILRITWESWHTVSETDPGEMLDQHHDTERKRPQDPRGHSCAGRIPVADRHRPPPDG
jgi:Co/Zn/Cd efflux system component